MTINQSDSHSHGPQSIIVSTNQQSSIHMSANQPECRFGAPELTPGLGIQTGVGSSGEKHHRKTPKF